MATNYNLKLNLISNDEKFSKGFRSANNALKKHQDEVHKTGSSYQSMQKQQRLLARYAKEVGVKFGTTSTQFKKAAGAARSLDMDIKNLNKDLTKTGVLGKKSAGGMGSIVGVATRRILPLLAIGAATKLIRKTGKDLLDFEQKMSQVSAVTGEVDDKLKALKETAIRISAVTPKTATEVANLEVELSKLGFTADETLVSIRSIIDLSVAGFQDLGETTKLVAVSLNAFNLSAGYTREVADTFAYAISNSALDLEKLATGLPNVAKAAQVFGWSIQKTTGILSILADAGIDASKMGTDLRRIVLELSKSGMTLDHALGLINKSTNKVTTAQELFKDRASVSALALAEQTKKIKGLDKEYSNISGTAEDMSEIMQENVAGSLVKVTSAWSAMVQAMTNDKGFVKDTLDLVAKGLNNISLAMGGLDQKNIDSMASSWRKFYEDVDPKDAITQIGDQISALERDHKDLFGGFEFGEVKVLDLKKRTDLLQGTNKRETLRSMQEQMEALKTILAEYEGKLEVPITIGGGDEDKDFVDSIIVEKGILADMQDALAELNKEQKEAFFPEDVVQYQKEIQRLQIDIEGLKGAFDDLDGAIADIDFDVPDIVPDMLTRWEEKMEDFKTSFPAELENALVGGIASAAEGVGTALANVLQGSEDPWADFGSAMLNTLGSTLVSLGTMLIAYGLTMDAFKKAFTDPIAAIGIGTAAVIIGSAFMGLAKGNPTKGVGGASFSSPSFSAGQGYSRYASDDNRASSGSSNDPIVEFLIKGENLVGVLKKQETKSKNMF